MRSRILNRAVPGNGNTVLHCSVCVCVLEAERFWAVSVFVGYLSRNDAGQLLHDGVT